MGEYRDMCDTTFTDLCDLYIICYDALPSDAIYIWRIEKTRKRYSFEEDGWDSNMDHPDLFLFVWVFNSVPYNELVIYLMMLLYSWIYYWIINGE